MSKKGASSVTTGNSYKTARSSAVSATSRYKSVRRCSRIGSREAHSAYETLSSQIPTKASINVEIEPHRQLHQSVDADQTNQTGRHIIAHVCSRPKRVLGDPDVVCPSCEILDMGDLPDTDDMGWVIRRNRLKDAVSHASLHLKDLSPLPATIDADLSGKASIPVEHPILSQYWRLHPDYFSPSGRSSSGSGLLQQQDPWEPFHLSHEQHKPISLCEEEQHVTKSRGKRHLISKILQKRPICHIIILLINLTIFASLGPGLWRWIADDDLSGGFTVAQYILGAGMLVVGTMVAIHVKTCTCWKKGKQKHEVVNDELSLDGVE